MTEPTAANAAAPVPASEPALEPSPAHPAPASLAADVEAVADTVTAHAGRIGILEDAIREIHNVILAPTDPASTDPAAAPGAAPHESLLQEIVDFLHWMFPTGSASAAGRTPPGTPSHLIPAPTPEPDHPIPGEVV